MRTQDDLLALLMMLLQGDGTGGPSPQNAPQSPTGMFGGGGQPPYGLAANPDYAALARQTAKPPIGPMWEAGWQPPMQPSRGSERVERYEDGSYGTPYDDYHQEAQMHPYTNYAEFLRSRGLGPR